MYAIGNKQTQYEGRLGGAARQGAIVVKITSNRNNKERLTMGRVETTRCSINTSDESLLVLVANVAQALYRGLRSPPTHASITSIRLRLCGKVPPAPTMAEPTAATCGKAPPARQGFA